MAINKSASKNDNFAAKLTSRIVKVKRFYFIIAIVLNSLCSFLYALCLSLFWSKINPEQTVAAMLIGILSFIVFIIVTNNWKIKTPVEQSLLLSLDIRFPEMKTSIYDRGNWDNASFQEDWNLKFLQILTEIRKTERTQLFNHMQSMIPVLVISALLWGWNGSYFLNSAANVLKSYAQRDAKIRVVQGGLDSSNTAFIRLNSKQAIPISLSQSNLVEVEYSPLDREEVPTIEIKKNPGDEKSIQSFQMIEYKDSGSTTFRIQFSVVESSFLAIPKFSGSKPLASFSVQQAESPHVSLQTVHPVLGDWLDDKPLDLLIKAQAKHPLNGLNLLITVAGHRFRESIYSVSGQDTYTVETQQSLSLEKYVDRDYEKIEIIAEAVDRSLPIPLIGHSPPLVIQTISSYGKYRKILSNLRQVKEHIDSAIAKSNPALKEDSNTLMSEVQKDAGLSPFFDGIDRSRIAKFHESMKANAKHPDLNTIYQLAQNLGNFLQEHEMLDDRERDRDFFVAARGLSHLLETGSSSTKLAEEKMLTFLSEREKRWKLRVGRLAHPEHLKLAKTVLDGHHFTKQMDKIIHNTLTGTQDDNKKSLRTLSESVSFYRQWIDELESVEDKEREERDKERQSGIASAQEELRKLQKRQLEVSKQLHGSDARSKNDVKEGWPTARMHENSNIEDGKKLEEKLNALTPRSAERLSAAIEAMKLTLQNGEDSEFSQSESFADLASRLLHQASKMTEEEQKNGRAAYRKSDSKYYGQSIVGGDVEIDHEYQVDPRYREDVLDEVVKSEYQGDNRTILNNFLKRIIR